MYDLQFINDIIILFQYRGPGSVVDSALDCESGGPGCEPRVSFGKALNTLKNHRKSKVDFLCIFPLSLRRPNTTIVVEWPLNPIQSINYFVS